MYETDVVLYSGRKTEIYASRKDKAELADLEGIRFIQNYQDEFFDIGAAREDAFQWKDLDISVLTNSDYIMEKNAQEQPGCKCKRQLSFREQNRYYAGNPAEYG